MFISKIVSSLINKTANKAFGILPAIGRLNRNRNNEVILKNFIKFLSIIFKLKLNFKKNKIFIKIKIGTKINLKELQIAKTKTNLTILFAE